MPSDARTQQTPDKEALRIDLLEGIRKDLATLTRTQKDASEGATHSENRAEHAKDTRATEQGYLARGLAERVEELHYSSHFARLNRAIPLKSLRWYTSKKNRTRSTNFGGSFQWRVACKLQMQTLSFEPSPQAHRWAAH
jgi:hypothetical protein